MDTAGLTPGYYYGTVTIEGFSANPVYNNHREIPVQLWVLRDRVNVDTFVMGQVFLDENGNGVQDPAETSYVGDVQLQLITASGVSFPVGESALGTGEFTLSQLPYAAYELVGEHPSYTMTTPPQDVVVRSDGSEVGSLLIGMQPTQNGDEPQFRLFLPFVKR